MDTKLLLIGSEARAQRALAAVLTGRGYVVATASDADAARRGFEQAPDLIVLDWHLPGNGAPQLLQDARRQLPEAPVVVLVDPGAAGAVEALRQGAFAYLTTPVPAEGLVLTVQRGGEQAELKRQVRRLQQQADERWCLQNLVGTSPALRRVCAQVQELAAGRGPVLLFGEVGTGKELLARLLHQLSPRKAGPFVVLSAGTLPKDRVEAELFGQVRERWHGPGERRNGKVVRAHHGTLFLDDVGELELAAQDRLLQLLTARRVRGAGADHDQEVDVRLIAATRRDLRPLVEQGRFRAELHRALAGDLVVLPPLRERREDIPGLAAAFLRELHNGDDRPLPRLTSTALEVLEHYGWPENVRELRGVVENLVMLAPPREVIDVADLPARFQTVNGVTETTGTLGADMKLEELERVAIQHCLMRTAGSRQRTAELLGISTRTLLRKINEYNLDDPLRQPKELRGARQQAPVM
jgi:DNA-binding NtrC family response regulator